MTSDSNGNSAQTTDVPATVSAEEFAKVKARAERFEAMAVDYEKKFKGVDIEALRAKAEEAELLRREAAGSDPKKIDDLIAKKDKEIRTSVEKELNELREANKTKESQIKELIVVERAFNSAKDKFNDDCHEDVKARLRQSLDVDEDGALIVKDKDGKVRYSTSKPSQKLSVDDYVAELIAEKPSWARAKTPAGGRSPGVRPFGSVASDTTVSLERYARMSPEERRTLPPKLRQQYATDIIRSSK